MDDLETASNVYEDIFHPDIAVYLDTVGASARDPNHPMSLKATVLLKERSRVTLQTGTDIGNTEGTGHIHATVRNIFGGAESVVASAATGTRTRSSYNLLFQTPIKSNPDFTAYLEAFSQSRTNQHYASHDEDMRGFRVGTAFLDKMQGRHEVSYSAIRREVLNLAEKASPAVRLSAGESVKSALHHVFTLDTRDQPLLPNTGSLIKATSELAGIGIGVSHLKYEVDTQAAGTLASGTRFPITFTTTFRAGLLYPLAPSLLSGSSENEAQPSLLPDRFQQGGPTTVRGFRENGLGPRADGDSVGGDVYVTAGASALFPLPNVDKSRPIRGQLWVNGGRLVALQRPGIAGVMDAVQGDIMNGLPSIAAGFGIVYAHPAARFEVNVGLPLVLRKGEKPRKGFQFGVGINFM